MRTTTPSLLALIALLALSSTSAAQAQGTQALISVAPPAPGPEDPVTVEMAWNCPAVFAKPQILGGPGERTILIAIDPDAPQPLAPCTTEPSYVYTFQLGILAPGSYRVQVIGGTELLAETRFAVGGTGRAVLPLHQGRFQVALAWRTAGGGEGTGQPVPLTGESGYFWFFRPDNVELVAKVIDGCALNGHFWVFLAGLTDVETDVTVTDTATGETKSYGNPRGRAFRPVQDTAALSGCP